MAPNTIGQTTLTFDFPSSGGGGGGVAPGPSLGTGNGVGSQASPLSQQQGAPGTTGHSPFVFPFLSNNDGGGAVPGLSFGPGNSCGGSGNGLPAFSLCQYHPRKELEMYCKVHQEAVCQTCIFTRHLGCQNKYLSQLALAGDDGDNAGW